MSQRVRARNALRDGVVDVVKILINLYSFSINLEFAYVKKKFLSIALTLLDRLLKAISELVLCLVGQIGGSKEIESYRAECNHGRCQIINAQCYD